MSNKTIPGSWCEASVPDSAPDDHLQNPYPAAPQDLSNPLLNAALVMAARGTRVFPCKPDGPNRKAPYYASGSLERGHLDASMDPDLIQRWWAQWPDALIGMPTGERTGIMVIDEDRSGALDGLGLPVSYTVRTAGGGRHLYLRYAEGVRNSESKLAEGVDVRGEGGHVIVPPSPGYQVQDRAPVADPPAGLVQRLLQPDKPRLEALEGGGEPEPTRSRFELPARITEGSRNGVLFRYGSSLRAHGHEHAAILEELRKANAERCAPPLEDRDLHKIAASASGHARGNASTVPPEVLEATASLEERAQSRKKLGLGAHSRWSVYRALLDVSKLHGWLHAGRDVAVRISVRELAASAGIADRTLDRALEALFSSGLVYRVSSNEGTVPGVIALRVVASQARTDGTRTTGGGSPTAVTSCLSGGMQPLYRLRHGPGRVGKTAASVLEAVLSRPGATRAEIAAMLGRDKPESLREPLRKLVDRGLLERRVRGRYWPSEELEHRLARERKITGEVQAERLQKAKHEREREAYRLHLEGEYPVSCVQEVQDREDPEPAGTRTPQGSEDPERAVERLVHQGMQRYIARAEVSGDVELLLGLGGHYASWRDRSVSYG